IHNRPTVSHSWGRFADLFNVRGSDDLAFRSLLICSYQPSGQQYSEKPLEQHERAPSLDRFLFLDTVKGAPDISDQSSTISNHDLVLLTLAFILCFDLALCPPKRLEFSVNRPASLQVLAIGLSQIRYLLMHSP